MGRIVFAGIDQAPIADRALPVGISPEGEVVSRAMLDSPGRPLMVWQHELAPGAALRLDRPASGHAIYLRSGSIEADGRSLDEGGAVICEHGGATALRAGADGAVLLDFHAPDGGREKPAKAGGHVHVVDQMGVARMGRFKDAEGEHPSAYSGILWAGSACPTCDLWLHRTALRGPVPQAGGLHSHSADEIIFVIEGEMLMGQRRLPPGTAVAIDGATRYRFGASDDGLAFLNFRTHGSTVSMHEGANREPMDERKLWGVAEVL